MHTILTQKKFIEALKGETSMYVRLTEAKKTEMVDKTRSTIILCLKDKVLMKVAREKTKTSMWAKVESLYMIKSFPHKFYHKQQLYSFLMVYNKSIIE